MGRWLERLTGKQFYIFVCFVMLISIPSSRYFTGLSNHGFAWGYDFSSLWNYQNCEAAQPSPYTVPDGACGDSRPMLYPPLLYQSFSWTRVLPLREATVLWSVLLLLMVAWSIRFWSGSRGKFFLLICCGLLLQMPFIFSVERGNNDAIVVLLWSFAMMAIRAGWIVPASMLVALCVHLKIYPVVACLLIVMVFFRSAKLSLTSILKRREGLFLGSLAIFGVALFFTPQTMNYWLDVFPRLGASRLPIEFFLQHSVASLFPDTKFLGELCFISFLIWIGWKLPIDDEELVFAMALALSTYLPRATFDYNLITLYPFLALLFQRAVRSVDWRTPFIIAVSVLIGLRFFLSSEKIYFNGIHVWIYMLSWFFIVRTLPSSRALKKEIA